GRDGRAVGALMASLAQSRRFALSAQALSALRAVFSADRADENETAATIRTMLRETGHLIDPHTAVGIAVAEKETRDPSIPMVVLGTAHPAKFPDAVEAACGVRPLLPEWLGDLDRRPERVTTLPGEQMAGERHILSASRSAHERAAACASRARRFRAASLSSLTRCRIWRPPRLACGSVPAAATNGRTSMVSRICSNTWRSRELHGVPPVKSRRKSRRSAATSMRQPRLRQPPTTPAFCGLTCRL